MKSVVDKITSRDDYNKKYFLGDIKSGNKRKFQPLDKHIGIIKDGVIKGYEPNLFELFNNKYKELEFTDIPQLNDKDLLPKWLNLYKELHKAITIRWTPDEISKLYKTDDGLNLIKLKDAVYTSKLNKIDMYFFCESKGRFTEITNVFFSQPNTPKKEQQYQIGLNGLQYYYLKPQNLLKYLKRYYSYERQNKNWKFMKVVSEFLDGNVNMLNSCNTDLGVLVDMLEYGYSVNSNLNYIHAHIMNIINRLQNIFEIDIPNLIFEDIKSIIDMRDSESIINIIEPIREYFMLRINEKTLEFINKIKIPILQL
ncbi:MAG: hypothetical protein EBR82_24045 [Caulobacteraceae bacterium]|nr:hypothetical protein [Caulobacteraceae bacterium]